ncbi:MAG: MFS transporter [Mycobacterium sp.]
MDAPLASTRQSGDHQVGTARQTTHNARKAATASFLGSMLEYYDFFIYGSAAALVFPALFFPESNPAVATIAALATFGVGYIARPLGGLILGHYGDRIGRKRVLIITLTVMGVSSLAVGLLPTYAQVGVVAPILLVICRLGQGFSAGGEAAGASTMTLEHSPLGRRGLFTSFTMSGCMAGIVLANLVFVPVALLPDEILLTWGWRVPFWGSTLVLLLAYVVRRRLDETPVFEEADGRDETVRVPVQELMRTQWADVVRVMFAALFAVFQTIMMVFGLAFATSPEIGVDRSTMLWVSVLANALAVVTIPIAAAVSDRIGRRPVWVAGALSCSVLVFVYFWAISTGNVGLIFLTGVLLVGAAYSGMNGLWPAYFSEQFAAPVRYSGFAVGSQLGLLLAGFAPTIGFAIMGTGPNGWVPVAAFAAICGVVSAVAVLFSRETYDVPIEQLGVRR